MRKGMVILFYVDDCIIVGKDMGEIDNFVLSMQNSSENFVLTNEDSIDKFLGIEIKRLGRQELEMSQPFLINRILSLLQLEHNGFETDSHDKLTPAATQILNKDLMGKPWKKPWKYRTAVRILSYLQGHTQPDISIPVHQTARFCNNPKLHHEQAITRIGRYLLGRQEKGIKYKIDLSKGLECYADADFAGGWDQTDPHNASNLMLCAGFIIK